jgi:hypothetical protein
MCMTHSLDNLGNIMCHSKHAIILFLSLCALYVPCITRPFHIKSKEIKKLSLIKFQILY